jgi:hypothetical protein
VRWIYEHPSEARRIGALAAEEMDRTRSAAAARAELSRHYDAVLRHPKRAMSFGDHLGKAPIDWFQSTLAPDEPTNIMPLPLSAEPANPSKGSLSHFLACFPDDEALLGLRRFAAR